MSPHRLVRVGGCVVGHQLDALCARAGRAQIQPTEGQAGRAEVDVAVDESRRHKPTAKILDLGIGEVTAADVIAAQPGDDVAADRHSGGVGVGRAVHPAVDQQLGRLLGGRNRHTAKLVGSFG